jgi:hypothetical protein
MRRLVWAALPLVVVAVLFAAILHARPTPGWRRAVPQERFFVEHCTWYCHNHGCRHHAVLPSWLTSDAGAFGATIRGLTSLGAVLSRDRSTGYSLANIVVFCIAWPLGTYSLWLLALWQHRKLKLSTTPKKGR